ncbi:hypothetical protein BJY01DRAFT_249468 [Aspergillus pseudoustus]|uniref:hydroxymethylglutaryl-CoA lyase n=1 Tax=Aspergillus pseudoustus TaxID=1810923 RepID=A0ABR4JQ30_9EURO
MKPPQLSHSATNSVRIVEVSPRDGLQNIPHHISTSTKVELISRLALTGVHSIELTSIVSPRAVPQLADCREVLGHEAVRVLHQHQPQHQHQQQLLDSDCDGGCVGAAGAAVDADAAAPRLPVLVPNVKGLDIALAHGVREVAVFVSATEGFSRANTNCSVEEGLERAREIARRARGVAVRGYISSVFIDPITRSPTPHSAVLRCVTTLLSSGIYEISLGDTTGIGTPSLVRSLLTYLTSHDVPVNKLAGHFHDSYGQGLRNVWEAYLCGVRVFDSSVAGLGGCPFAPGAKGNVATEEVIEMLEGKGVRTGVEFSALAEVGRWVKGVVEVVENDEEKEGRTAGNVHGSGNASAGHIRSSASPVRSRLPTNWGGCAFVRPVVYD